MTQDQYIAFLEHRLTVAEQELLQAASVCVHRAIVIDQLGAALAQRDQVIDDLLDQRQEQTDRYFDLWGTAIETGALVAARPA